MEDFGDLPREHVVRPLPPWRIGQEMTECGRKPGEHVISRDAFLIKVRKQGKTRAAMTTCMTCFETAQRWPDWNTNPLAVIAREVKHLTYWGGESDKGPLRDELLAFALLAEAHREEFDATLEALGRAVPFGLSRARKERRGRL